MKVKGLISANKHTPRDCNSLAMDCLADEDYYDCDELYECEKAFECSDELKSTTKTLSETIYTEWEVIADE